MGESQTTIGKIRPDFVHWSFGSQPFSSLPDSQSSEFQFSFSPSLERRDYSFRREVYAAAERIDQKRAGRTVALCFSGGLDSELIALVFHELGIPFELYFLDLWGINRAAFDEWAPPFLRRIGKKANVVRAERSFFYEQHSVKMFEELGVEFPTYLALPLLFSSIPENQFIVTGDGDLNRSGPLYEAISVARGAPGEGGIWIPFASSATAYWHWAEKRGREGEYCFFSSTPALLAASFTHPQFKAAYPFSDARQVVLAEFPELAPRPKTTNWDGRAYRENVWLRSWLERHGRKSPKLRAWQESVGTIARMESLFHSAL